MANQPNKPPQPLPTALQPTNVALAQLVEAVKKINSASRAAAPHVESVGLSLSGLTRGLVAAQAAAGGFSDGIRQFVGKINNQVAELVRVYNPAAVQKFELATRDLNAAIGRALLPVLNNLTSVVRAVGDGIASLNPAGQRMIGVLAGAAVGIGAMTIATVGLSAAINSATGGLPVILGAVVGIGAGVALTSRNLSGFKAAVEELARPLVTLGNVFAEAFQKVLAAVAPTIQAVAAMAAELGSSLVPALAGKMLPVVEQFAGFLAAAAEQLLPAVLTLLPVLVEVAAAVQQFQLAIASALLPAVGGILQAVGALVSLNLTFLTNGLRIVGPILKMLFLPVMVPLKLFAAAVEAVGKVVAAVAGPLQTAFDQIGAIFGEMIDEVGSALTEIFADFLAQLPDIKSMLAEAVAFFSRAMKIVSAVIKDVAGVVRTFLGVGGKKRSTLDVIMDSISKTLAASGFKPGAGVGLAVRTASTGSMDDYIRRARESAFTAGKGEETGPTMDDVPGKVNEIGTTLDRIKELVEDIKNSQGAQVVGGVGAAASHTFHAITDPFGLRNLHHSVTGK